MSVNITTIIPVYNGEKTISKCLDSILSQTVPPVEIIVVNDGSTDGTENIIRDYCSRCESVTMVRSSHAGVSAARNLGIQSALGDYISFVDADDYLAPDMYEKLSEAMHSNAVDISVCGYFTVKDGVTTSYVPSLSGSVTASDMINDMFTGVSEGFVHNRLFRKNLLAGNGFPTDITHCEDLLLQVDILIKNPGLSIYYVNKPLYYYVNSSQSATSKLFRENEFVYNKAFQRIFSLLMKKPDLLASSVQKYRSILEFSMYSVLTSEPVSKAELSRMQSEMKQWKGFIAKHSHPGAKSMLRYNFIASLPRLYKALRLS